MARQVVEVFRLLVASTLPRSMHALTALNSRPILPAASYFFPKIS